MDKNQGLRGQKHNTSPRYAIFNNHSIRKQKVSRMFVTNLGTFSNFKIKEINHFSLSNVMWIKVI